jgi:hypothetical protein
MDGKYIMITRGLAKCRDGNLVLVDFSDMREMPPERILYQAFQ